jgi:hypothetical protein
MGQSDRKATLPARTIRRLEMLAVKKHRCTLGIKEPDAPARNTGHCDKKKGGPRADLHATANSTPPRTLVGLSASKKSKLHFLFSVSNTRPGFGRQSIIS